MDESLCFASAATLARRIASKEVSPVELVEAHVERIEALDGHYGSYLTTTFERAREQAREAERAVIAGEPLGPLHGVPFGAKDLLDTAGVRTTCGSQILADRVPRTNATTISRLTNAGAILLGKHQLYEFAVSEVHPDLPPVNNPYALDRTTGGSSSGSAAAVAAGLCPFSIGSDTLASIRLPAAWTGCVGFKPSFGRVSCAGGFPLAPSLDHFGPISRTVEDAALVMSVIAGHDPRDPLSLREPLPGGWPRPGGPTGLRVGYDEQLVTADTEESVARCTREAVAELQGAGATLVPVEVPMLKQARLPCSYIFAAEAAAVHRAYFPERAAEYGPGARELLEGGALMTVDLLVAAQHARIAFRDAIAHLFTQVDVLLTPITPTNAPHDFQRALGPKPLVYLRYTTPWNMTGAPALSLPWGLDADGLPQAVQIIGPVGADERVLSVAAALERSVPPPPAPTPRDA